jgi:hypothetical protein
MNAQVCCVVCVRVCVRARAAVRVRQAWVRVWRIGLGLGKAECVGSVAQQLHAVRQQTRGKEGHLAPQGRVAVLLFSSLLLPSVPVAHTRTRTRTTA